MTRGPLFSPEYRPQFSGHETFPLRYGWLKKVVDSLQAPRASEDNRFVFNDDSAIARFGVGKNMVASMRYWAAATEVISELPSGQLAITQLGETLFGAEGIDPYLESQTTLWMLHWQLAGKPQKTTWFWAFNHFSSTAFERDQFVRGLEALIAERGWNRTAASTIRRDVDCFIRTYAPRSNANQSSDEDTLESPLTELGLIQQLGKRDGFRFVRNSKPTLSLSMFAYALTDFWQQFSSSRSLSLEAVSYEPGSPGRVFLLTEEDVAERLRRLEDASRGAFRWSETAGLRQVMVTEELDLAAQVSAIRKDVEDESLRDAA